MKREDFAKLWNEFQAFVREFNAKAIEEAKGTTIAERIERNIYTVGDGFDSFIAWCNGKYDN